MTNFNNLSVTQARPHIEHLPNEILLKILKDMSPESIISLMKASKSLSSIKSWDIVFSKMLHAPFKASHPKYLPGKRVERIQKLFKSKWFNDIQTTDAKKIAISNLKIIVNHEGYFEPLLDRVILVSSRKAKPTEENQEEIQKIADRNFGVIQHTLSTMTKELQTILILSMLTRAFREYMYEDIFYTDLDQITSTFEEHGAFFDEVNFLSDEEHEEPAVSPKSLDLLHLCLLAKKYCNMEDTIEIKQSVDKVREEFYGFINRIINSHKGKKSSDDQKYASFLEKICVHVLEIKGLRTNSLNQRLMAIIFDSLTDYQNPYIDIDFFECDSESESESDSKVDSLMHSIYSGLLKAWSMEEVKALYDQSNRSVKAGEHYDCLQLVIQLIKEIKLDISEAIKYPRQIPSMNFEQIKLLYLLKLSMNNPELELYFEPLEESLANIDKTLTAAQKLQAVKTQIQLLLDDTTLDASPSPSTSQLSL